MENHYRLPLQLLSSEEQFGDYLVPIIEFEKSRQNDQLQLAEHTDCHEYLQARMTLLTSRLEEVNAMTFTADLPDVDISDRGVKITPLENGVSENFLRDRITLPTYTSMYKLLSTPN